MSLTVSIRKRLSPDFELDVAFDAPPGITILFGASGSGKTTVLRAVAGLVRPDAGRIGIGPRIMFDAQAARDVPPPERRAGYVFQQLALFPHMTVADNLSYGIAALPEPTRRARITAVAESFRIAHLLARRPAAISGGERQRVALARSLVTDPAVLLLDEPLAALDHATQSRIIDDLRAWNEAHGIPVLYVTHSHREVFALGERVVVLERGRVLAAGTPEDVLESPVHETIAQLAGFENFFTASVLSRRPEAGIMHCRIEEAETIRLKPDPTGAMRAAEIEVPLARVQPGARVRIAIRAGDILLATEPPRGLSARNVLAGRLIRITREGARVVAEVDAGEPFLVHLTPSAAESLRLAEGMAVWLIIKTHSCRIVSV